MALSWKPNRQQRRQPKGGKFWCIHCDCQVTVGNGRKCPLCKRRNGIRRDRKPSPTTEPRSD